MCNEIPRLSFPDSAKHLKCGRHEVVVDPTGRSGFNIEAEHKMPHTCVAYGCGKTSEDNVTLFKFPKDPLEFRKWEKQVQRTRIQWVATPNSYLCSEHFGREYFEPKGSTAAPKLKPGAVPTVFVRPHCAHCYGVGCAKCLPAVQQQSFSEQRESTVSLEDSY